MREKPASMPKHNETDDTVKLKPFMGMRPGVWLTVLYSFILLVILFFLLVFPGLTRGGAVLSVKTEPMGAAIRINDVYMGTSADGIFLPKGSYTVEAVLPGFEKASSVHEIPRRVFGSLFFPLRKKIEFSLTASDPASAFAKEAADFAAWSFGPEPTAVWQIPLSLSEGAYRAGPSGDPAMREILQAASRFTVTRAGLRDLVRAKILTDSRGLSPSPAGLTRSISDILLFLSENPGSAELLAGLLPQEPAALLNASDWIKNKYPPFTVQSLAASVTAAAFPAQLELAGIRFRAIPAAEITNSSPGASRFLHDASIGNFMVCETPVPRSLFETFIGENPQWNEGQTDYYPEQISVYPSDTFDREIITGVTWHAAQAFCAWLTGRLPASLAGMEVRLPTEAEWKFAAGSGILGLGEGGWEWCADPFAPHQFIKASPDAIQAVGSPERALRGKISSSLEWQRASLPPEFSSPFVSFRPVIAQRDN
jgi:formylglycine-generating enzyme required for sulfatase activity